MPLEFNYLNSPPVVAVTCDNRKAMGKEKYIYIFLDIGRCHDET